jgi:hypothetical protein
MKRQPGQVRQPEEKRRKQDQVEKDPNKKRYFCSQGAAYNELEKSPPNELIFDKIKNDVNIINQVTTKISTEQKVGFITTGNLPSYFSYIIDNSLIENETVVKRFQNLVIIILALMSNDQRLNMLTDVFHNFRESVTQFSGLSYGRVFVLRTLCSYGFGKSIAEKMEEYKPIVGFDGKPGVNCFITEDPILKEINAYQREGVIDDALQQLPTVVVRIISAYDGEQKSVEEQSEEIKNIITQTRSAMHREIADSVRRDMEANPKSQDSHLDGIMDFRRVRKSKRKSPKRTSSKRKSPKRNSSKRKSSKRKSAKSKSRR